MEMSEWTVWFTNGTYLEKGVTVTALNVDQAIILAKAIRIKKGLDYTVTTVEASE